MKYRKTKWLSGKPSDMMIWGVNKKFKWLLNKLPFEAFIYITATAERRSGIVLYGVAVETIDISEKYWPQGESWAAFYVEVKAAAPGVLEVPESPLHWQPIDRGEVLEKAGIRILPGPQRLDEKSVAALKALIQMKWSKQ